MFFFFEPIAGNDQDGDVCLPEGFPCFFDSEVSYGSGVVDAGSVDQYDGGDTGNFVAFLDGVGGCACLGGNDGFGLSQYGVDEGAFAGVASAGDDDVLFVHVICIVLLLLR